MSVGELIFSGDQTRVHAFMGGMLATTAMFLRETKDTIASGNLDDESVEKREIVGRVVKYFFHW